MLSNYVQGGVTPIGAVSRPDTAVKKINSQTVKALLGEVHDQAVGPRGVAEILRMRN